MKNLRIDRKVEKRCSEFMQKMEDKIKTLESKIESKVNSEEVTVKRIVDESGKANIHVNSNTEAIEDTVNKKVCEIRESTTREKNIIIYMYGVNEIDSNEPSVRKQKDTKCLDNDETCIKSVVRIGKKKTSNKVDVPADLLNGDARLVDGESESSVHVH